jgi:RNA-binding protein YlmH
MKDVREFDGLYARLEDMKKRAIRGELGISAFLSPRELHYAMSYLGTGGDIAFGGYSDAERKRIYFLPEYMENVTDVSSFADFGEDSGIVSISVRGSGFVRLSHRDFMGSLLGMGIERSVIGDIVVLDGESAVVMCDSKIADFLINEWTEVGHDKVRCSRVTVGEDFAPERRYAPISDTVASARLDCIVAALCNLSRERARACVVSGLCELDYECEERPDREVTPPALISVRGYGKYRVCSIGEQTKKGRLRLTAQKFL